VKVLSSSYGQIQGEFVVVVVVGLSCCLQPQFRFAWLVQEGSVNQHYAFNLCGGDLVSVVEI
jgi:hypothetical protein